MRKHRALVPSSAVGPERTMETWGAAQLEADGAGLPRNTFRAAVTESSSLFAFHLPPSYLVYVLLFTCDSYPSLIYPYTPYRLYWFRSP